MICRASGALLAFGRMRACVVLIVAVVAQAAIAAPATFRPEEANPYFVGGPAAEAAAKLNLEEWAAAAKLFDAYLKKHPHAKDHKQAAFLMAYAELKSGQFNAAAQHFDGLIKSYPLLADYQRTWSARAHLQAGRAMEALARAKQVPPASA